MAPKRKAPKAPTVPVSLTSSNDIEKLQQELYKVQKERDQFELEKQQIQVERDKIFSLWTIAEERVAKAKDQISALDSDMLQNHRRYLKELHVSKQTAEYFHIEFQKAASELKAGGSVSTEEEEEEETIMSKPDQLRIEIRAMNLELEHDRQLNELSNHLEKHVSVQDSMKEKKDVCVKHLTQVQQYLGNMTNNGIIKVEEQRARDINGVKEAYKNAVKVCLDNNTSLVKENNAMKEQLKEDNSKKAEALLVQHKNLTDHLSKINKKLGVFAEKCAKISMVSDKLLNQRKRQLGRDQLSLDSFMDSLEEIQVPYEADLKSLSLEYKLEALTDNLKHSQDKLSVLLFSHKTDQTAHDVLTSKRAQRKGLSVDELDAKLFEYGEPVQDAELQTEKKKMFVSLLVESLVSETYRKAKGDTTLQCPEAIIRDIIFDMTWTEVEDFNFDTSRKLKNLHKAIFSDLCKNCRTVKELLASMHVAPERVAKCIASSFRCHASSFRCHVTHPEQHVTIRDLLSALSKLFTRKNRVGVV